MKSKLCRSIPLLPHSPLQVIIRSKVRGRSGRSAGSKRGLLYRTVLPKQAKTLIKPVNQAVSIQMPMRACVSCENDPSPNSELCAGEKISVKQ